MSSFAVRWLAHRAARTVTTRHETQNDVIAWSDFADCRTYALDDASAFMPEDDWQGNGIYLVAYDNIGMAHPGRDNPDQHFIIARLIDRQRFDLKRTALVAHNSGPGLSGLRGRLEGH
jgi:hypothetical protein